MFVNLNNRSYYSLLKSSLRLDQIISFSLQEQSTYASLIDLNTMYGTIEFYDLCIKNKLRPIIGLNLVYRGFDVLLIALNEDGYKTLIYLSSLVNTNKELDFSKIMMNNVAIIYQNNQHFSSNAPLVYQNYNDELDDYLPSKLNVSFDSFSDALYDVVNALRTETKLELNSEYHDTVNNRMLTETEALKLYRPLHLKNLDELLNHINLVISNQEPNLPVYQDNIPNNSQLLKEITTSNLKKYLTNRYGNRLTKEVVDTYKQRLKKELAVIEEKEFVDYFFVVYDFIQYAIKSDIMVGPGRGSACGSLISFLLEITKLDPIEYDLIFERFLNKSRKGMPDIDIDIADEQRPLLIDYIFNKYGFDKVCFICTFIKMKLKMAIRDLGRVLNIDLKDINELTKLINDDKIETLDDFDNFVSKNRNKILSQRVSDFKNFKYRGFDFFQLVFGLINFPRSIGTHAAGIVISNLDIKTVIPIQNGIDDYPLTQYPLEYLERFGLIKFDLLSLKNLSIVRDTVNLIRIVNEESVDINNINLHDDQVFEQLRKGETTGIFQLESPGMVNLIKKIKPRNIADIALVSALFRPGPSQNSDRLVKRRDGLEQIVYWNNECKKVLEETVGIIVYQEQVIKLVNTIAGFDEVESDNFRRAISKKDHHLIDKYKDEFIKRAIQRDYNHKLILEIFDYIKSFADYGFNKSHALAYALLSYQLAYLKFHYPICFICNLLNTTDGKEKTYFKLAIKNNIKIIPPSIKYHNSDYQIDRNLNAIIIGFKRIKGVGNEILNKLNLIADDDINDCFKCIKACIFKYKLTINNLITFIKIGAFDCYGYNRKFLIEHINDILKFDVETFEECYVKNSDAFNSTFNNEYLKDEEELLGFCLKSLLLSDNDTIYTKYRDYQIVGVNELTDEPQFVIAKVIKKTETFTRTTNKKIFFIDVLVNEKQYQFTIFHKGYELYQMIKEDQIYLFTMRKFNRFNVIENIKEIGEK